MALGVSVSQPPVTLINTANAVSQKYFVPFISDNIFLPSPAWWRMTRLGKKLKGGASIVLPVAFLEETSGGAYWGAQILDTSLQDSVQPSEWQWKAYYQAIVLPYLDILFNAGPTQVVDLIKTKEEIAMASLLQKLSRALWHTSPQNTTNDLDDLVAAVATTNNTYAGIDRTQAANAFWKPGGPAGTITNLGGNLSNTAIQTAYGAITFGNDEPDTILTTQAGYNAFWGLQVGNIRYLNPDEETTRVGFRRHFVFNNAVVLHDQFVPAGDLFLLNTKYVCVYFLSDDYFTIDPFLKPSNQRILVSNIYVTLNVVVKSPRTQNAITGISNA